MKKIILLISALIVCAAAYAQDARGRLTETIVADVLAQMPAQNASSLESDMADLAGAAPESVVQVAAFLSDPDTRTSAEYALQGLVNYISAPGRDASAIRVGLSSAIGAAGDSVTRSFLESCLRLISEPGDEPQGKLSLPSRRAALRRLGEAFGGTDRVQRMIALDQAGRTVPERRLSSTLRKLYDKAGDAARADILYWAGDHGDRTLLSRIEEALSGGGEAAVAAAYAKTGFERREALEAYRAAHAGDDYSSYMIEEEKAAAATAEARAANLTSLTDEERQQGFVMLFDGSDLTKWHGDFDGYKVDDGTIYVSASYGSEGNLYTNKQYRNFIFRFEFCFLVPGINNGVGIRTPEGVDAAYEGMCEVQILDHDAPVYKNLREYQVHGSAYGLIPARRIVHKPLGEWSEEEIEVRGNHVKVTVNGEVITDGDLMEACHGIPVVEGEKYNPNTVDHRNHPGLPGERGYISFCGHGEGLRLRNVRILELPD